MEESFEELSEASDDAVDKDTVVLVSSLSLMMLQMGDG